MKELLHHLFIPRQSNNFRSKLLHHSSLLIVIVLLLAATIGLNTVQTHYSDVLGISTNISVDELLNLTNQERVKNGLKPLTLNQQLVTAATNKASDMFAKNYWAHNAPDGTPPWVFFKSAGYDYVYAGENLARGFNSAQDVVNAWMASPGHRENLLSEHYTEIGFAVQTGTLTGDETALVVQEFGSRNIAAAPLAPTSEVAQVPATPMPQVTIPATISLTPSPTLLPSPTLTAAPTVASTPAPSGTRLTAVAAISSEPLVNKPTLTKSIAFILLALFISLLLLDMIIVERNNIVRFVGHNIDHIIFLAILLALVLIVTKGAIL